MSRTLTDIQSRLRRRLVRALGATDADSTPAQAPAAGESTTILDGYLHTMPSDRNAIDIFKGEWSSRLPEPYAAITGPSELFDDHRIHYLIDTVGGIAGFDVLELGPLEAGHTTMLEQAGAASVLAIEANTRAYLKCLVVKETLALHNSRFLCGDLTEFLRASDMHFDLCVASGVLYHLREPAAALALMSRAADRLLLWTHYYDEAAIQDRPDIAAKFGPSRTTEVEGLEVVEHYYDYGAALGWNGFSGGSAAYSNWLSRDDILSCLHHFGFTKIDITDDTTEHPNGPAFTVLARR
jgi:hypothetical protein